MTLAEYLAQDPATYHYVGTMWGDNPNDLTGSALAPMITSLGYDDIVTDDDTPGYHIRGRAITYHNGVGIEETVLIRNKD